MTETIIKGDTFNVTAEGRPDAPAILLAHSLGTNLHVFDRQAAALSPHFHVIRFDARGHGGSHVSEGDYSIEQLGEDALAILDALRIEKAHFIGLSAGGLVGLWLLRHAPDRIDRAVLANAAAQIASHDFWNERIRIVHENGIGALAPSIIENWFTRHYREQHPEEVHRVEQALAAMSGEGYAGGAAAVRDADFRAELAHIHHPVLVIVGKHDPVTPPGVGALVASSIPGAKIVTVEAAHLSPIEAAEAFNDAVTEFLLSAEAKPSSTETHEAPPKPRKPRVPKPKPAPVVEAAHEAHATPEPVPAKKPEHRPRAEHKAEPVKTPEPVAAPARKSSAKKSAAKKAAAKKRTAKKAASKKSSRKGALKKRVARKPVKKSVARKAAAKRRPIKKPVKKTGRRAVKKSTRKIAKRPV
jgi:3-oxoadipate enol-lactonase